MKKNIFFTTEMIVALAATLISICALTVSIYEVQIMQREQIENRKAQMISVWPNLSVNVSPNSKGLQLGVENNGIGPAIIKFFGIHINGKPLESITELSSKFKILYPNLDSYEYTYGNIRKGRVFSAGQRLTVLEIPRSELSQKVWRDMVSGNIDMKFCFCSVYEECWVNSLQTMIAESVSECN